MERRLTTVFWCGKFLLLDENFPLCWMGRVTPAKPALFRWPPYSPDLTPCDFFLWGYLKSRIYRTQPANLNELRERIVNEFQFQVLPEAMVIRSIDSYARRLEICLEVEGRSVERSYGN
uniref:Transposase n=1 Tax=Ditylenchus dipsaci TaxID=166011 RepID=A0A915DJC0_9BILA